MSRSSPPHFKRPDTGFTLVELVTVILILGLLAAVALPRMLSLTTEARVAKLQGLQAALSATVNQLHALCLLQAYQCSDKVPSQTVVPGTTEMPRVSAWGNQYSMYYGWPTAWLGYGPTAGYLDVVSALPSQGYVIVPYVSATFRREFQIGDAPDPSNCKLTYQLPSLGGTPTYLLTTTGC